MKCYTDYAHALLSPCYLYITLITLAVIAGIYDRATRI